MFDEIADPALPDPTMAAEACCKLISTYLANHKSVEWSDVQSALETALKAFDLPQSSILDMAGQTDTSQVSPRPLPYGTCNINPLLSATDI